jgi:murein DD-endopeptidase MepM/ murein hydrolase activator NlpD
MPADDTRKDHWPTLRRVLVGLGTLALLAIAGWWAWQQPFMARARTMYEVSRMPPPTALPVPVDGVVAADIADTWGAPRGHDRQHQGVDIFAPRGTLVRSTTRGVVASVREGGLGGKQVWIVGPARQRHYYAHLDSVAAELHAGDVVWPGDALGGVGDSGNARGTPTHLHYGIHGSGGPLDPLPLLRAWTGTRAGDTP